MKQSNSLYNFSLSSGTFVFLFLTPSIGWTVEEVEILRSAIIKYGLGNWTHLLQTNVLPGKTISQLNNQTRKLLGQQSSAEFAGLHIDVLQVGAHNAQIIDAHRKSGIIVHTGKKRTKAEIAAKIAENKQRFELSQEIWSAMHVSTHLTDAQREITEKMQRLLHLRSELHAVEAKIAAAVGVTCIDNL